MPQKLTPVKVFFSAGHRPFFLLLVTAAALLRFACALAGANVALVTSLAGVAWSAAFGLFVLLYAPLLLRLRTR